jgi:hypothetical protein
MSTTLDSFEIGALYSNEEIYKSLSVGNAGGVRAKSSRNGTIERLVMMTSVPSARQLSENPYSDRIEGDTLIYTGAGREGDQTISGPNARIIEPGVRSFIAVRDPRNHHSVPESTRGPTRAYRSSPWSNSALGRASSFSRWKPNNNSY